MWFCAIWSSRNRRHDHPALNGIRWLAGRELQLDRVVVTRASTGIGLDASQTAQAPIFRRQQQPLCRRADRDHNGRPRPCSITASISDTSFNFNLSDQRRGSRQRQDSFADVSNSRILGRSASSAMLASASSALPVNAANNVVSNKQRNGINASVAGAKHSTPPATGCSATAKAFNDAVGATSISGKRQQGRHQSG